MKDRIKGFIIVIITVLVIMGIISFFAQKKTCTKIIKYDDYLVEEKVVISYINHIEITKKYITDNELIYRVLNKDNEKVIDKSKYNFYKKVKEYKKEGYNCK